MKRIGAMLFALLLALSLGLSTPVAAAAEAQDERPTVTIWWPYIWWGTQMNDMNDNLVYQWVEDQLGINIEFITPNAGTESVEFNLLLASDELPDILFVEPWYFNGGFPGALSDGIILDLAPYLKAYSPNYYGYVQSEKYGKDLVDDEGRVLAYECLMDGPLFKGSGPAILKRAADALGLSDRKLETIDEWDAVLYELKAIQEEMGWEYIIGSTDPRVLLTMGLGVSPLGSYTGHYVKMDDEIVSSVIIDDYKVYLSYLNKWYKDGIIDPSYQTRDEQEISALELQQKVPVVIEYWDNLGRYIPQGVEFTPFPWPVKEEGGKLLYYHIDDHIMGWAKAAINASSDNIEAAMKVMDFGYTKEGSEAYEFGTQTGASRLNEEGKYVMTDEYIAENAGGQNGTSWLKTLVLGIYLRPEGWNDDGWRGRTEYEINALKQWAPDFPGERNFSWHTYFNDEEAAVIAKYESGLGTYVSESEAKFINGELDIEADWDHYVAQCEALGVHEIEACYQAAYDRYLAR